MPDNRDKRTLINQILGDKEEIAMEEEEIIHLLLERKLAKNTVDLADAHLTIGQRMADGIAKFAGSWTFISIFLSCLVVWVIVNMMMLAKAPDPYPFILLNLILSCVAAMQAPVIMMSQNRQEEKDRLRSLNDYRTNLKSEIILEDLHQKIDELLSRQELMLNRLDKIEKSTPPEL
ncbi:MAG: DUF1003 domain-containing protein [Eubacteriales bacterium]|nr:DUF1003 domain-containing protein [Eubacteriales bacterium]